MSYVMHAYIRPASKMLQEHQLKERSETGNDVQKFKYFPKFLLDSRVSFIQDLMYRISNIESSQRVTVICYDVCLRSLKKCLKRGSSV